MGNGCVRLYIFVPLDVRLYVFGPLDEPMTDGIASPQTELSKWPLLSTSRPRGARPGLRARYIDPPRLRHMIKIVYIPATLEG
jgi:hypothetical protein